MAGVPTAMTLLHDLQTKFFLYNDVTTR